MSCPYCASSRTEVIAKTITGRYLKECLRCYQTFERKSLLRDEEIDYR